MTPDVSVVILNYKVRDLVLRLLTSLFEHTKGVSFEVIVVDNASNDGLGAALRAQFPEVQFIGHTRNLGFAAGCNSGARIARGRHILLLNPDTELREDAITALVRAADSHPDAGVVGAKIVNPDGSWQPSVRAFPRLIDQLSIMLKVHHLWRHAPWLQRYFCDRFNPERAQTVDQVIGAAFLITTEAHKRVGLLDERYFIWYEEVDYCRMVRDAGLNVWYIPEARVVHYGGQSFDQVFAVRKQRYMDESLAKYFAKQKQPIAALVVRLVHPLALALAWLVGVLRLRRKSYGYT